MQQKIIPIGNSTGIIIPKALLQELGLETGSEVMVEKNPNHQSLTITKKGEQVQKSSLTPEFLETIGKIKKQYYAAFKELAGK